MAGQRDDRRYETNELEWWSNWAKLTWTTKDSFTLTSKVFDEPFFNRVGILSPDESIRAILPEVERVFAREEAGEPSFLFKKSRAYSRLGRELRKNGYGPTGEVMSVLKMGYYYHNHDDDNRHSAFTVSPQVKIVAAEERTECQRWVEAYLLSFYGDTTTLLDATMQVVNSLRERKEEVTLLLARYNGDVAGTLAISRSEGLGGIYCVGTVPVHRRKGVATALLAAANEMMLNEGRSLILQTILSDGVEPLYLKLGFRRLYLKEFFSKLNRAA